MKASEILRALADKLDSMTQPETPDSNSAELVPVEVDNTDHTEDSVFVSPLQQKLELLKKATGVESHYDDEESCGCEQTPCGCDSADDEMSIMKRNAGITPVVLQVASDDEPLDM